MSAADVELSERYIMLETQQSCDYSPIYQSVEIIDCRLAELELQRYMAVRAAAELTNAVEQARIDEKAQCVRKLRAAHGVFKFRGYDLAADWLEGQT